LLELGICLYVERVMSDPSPFVVTETLSKVYYKGLPSEPPLIATTKPGPFEAPTGPEAYSVLKELRELGDHPLASAWDHGVADRLRRSLNTMRVNWTSIEALRIVEVGESSGPAIVWIGVEFGALSFEEGSVVALKCRTLIDSHDIHDYHVEIRESRVMRQAGNRFFDPVPLSDPTFTARDPYTATLGIPISAKNRHWAEGTGGSTSAPAATARTYTSSLPGTLSFPLTRTTTRKRAERTSRRRRRRSPREESRAHPRRSLK